MSKPFSLAQSQIKTNSMISPSMISPSMISPPTKTHPVHSFPERTKKVRHGTTFSAAATALWLGALFPTKSVAAPTITQYFFGNTNNQRALFDAAVGALGGTVTTDVLNNQVPPFTGTGYTMDPYPTGTSYASGSSYVMTPPSLTTNGTGFAPRARDSGFKLTMINPAAVSAFGLDLAYLDQGTISVTLTGTDGTTVTQDFAFDSSNNTPAGIETNGPTSGNAFLGWITDQPFTEGTVIQSVSTFATATYGGTIRYGVAAPAPGASDPTSQPQPQVGSAQGQLVGSTLALMPLVTSMIHVHLRGVAGPTGGACGGGSWPDVRKT